VPQHPDDEQQGGQGPPDAQVQEATPQVHPGLQSPQPRVLVWGSSLVAGGEPRQPQDTLANNLVGLAAGAPGAFWFGGCRPLARLAKTTEATHTPTGAPIFAKGSVKGFGHGLEFLNQRIVVITGIICTGG